MVFTEPTNVITEHRYISVSRKNRDWGFLRIRNISTKGRPQSLRLW
jgi:hypothetical protein